MSNETTETTDPVIEYGFTAVPANAETLLEQANLKSKPPPPAITTSATPIPTTPTALRIYSYAQRHLPEPTFNHSMRVYHYGLAMKQYLFPEWGFTDETYLLACMFHDIGTTPSNIGCTRLSFEFYGGLLAMEVLLLQKHIAVPRAQAESVAEAIIRHQDLRDVGSITAVGGLLQLATIFDNTGDHAQLVHPDTVSDVVENFPRLGWSSCFAGVIEEETSRKPWAHTTVLGEEFPKKVLEHGD